MPRIKNTLYLAFKGEGGNFTTIKTQEFKEKLDKINYKNKFKQAQARALAILLFYTGRRPIEIVGLRNTDIIKEKKGYLFLFRTAKKGINTRVLFPAYPELSEVHDLAKRQPDGVFVLPEYRKNQFNKIKYLIHKKTDHPKTITKTYPRTSHLLNYFCNKWFGFPPYLFRHNRYTHMAELGASDREIAFAKGSRDTRSVQAYVHFSQVMQSKVKRYLKTD